MAKNHADSVIFFEFVQFSEFSTWKTMLDIRRGVLKVVFVNGLFGQFNGDSRAIFKTLKIIQIRQKMTELPDFLSSVLEKQCQCQICPLNMAKITRTFLLFHFIHWTGLAERFCWQIRTAGYWGVNIQSHWYFWLLWQISFGVFIGDFMKELFEFLYSRWRYPKINLPNVYIWLACSSQRRCVTRSSI